MRVILDARWIFPELSGVGVVTQELVRHLPAVAPDDEFVFLFRDPALRDRVADETGFLNHANACAELVPWGPFDPRGQWDLPRRLRRWGADLFHSPNYMFPLPGARPDRPGRVRMAATVHDLIPLLFPHYTPRALKTRLFPLYRALMREVGRRADLLLTVSEATRADLVRELCPDRPDRVVVVPNGIGEAFLAAEPLPAPRPPHLLYVGRFDPYKNVPLLIEAFARLRKDVPDARLTIIGPPDARYPEARERARALGVEPALTWSGYQETPALVEAYRRAAVFVLPSRYEGFGLPVLEAMACGTPVVCSDIPALAEVAGDAAVRVPPDDAAALAAALRRVLVEPALAARLVEAGRRRAREFSWRRTAEGTHAAYRACMAGPGAVPN